VKTRTPDKPEDKDESSERDGKHTGHGHRVVTRRTLSRASVVALHVGRCHVIVIGHLHHRRGGLAMGRHRRRDGVHGYKTSHDSKDKSDKQESSLHCVALEERRSNADQIHSSPPPTTP
jgi:hypothetical protein